MYQAQHLKSPIYKKYSKSNLPMKYIEHDIKDFRILGDSEKEKKHNEEMFEIFMDYYNNAELYLRKGEGIILCGSVGIAKTWLMTHLAKRIIDIFDDENGKIQEEDIKTDKSNRFYYIQATTISQMVFTGGLSEKELTVRRGIKEIAGLWIDDISKLSETKSGAEISFLDDILRWRDLNGLTTFYTSQLPFDSVGKFEGLDKALSKPIHDIIRGNTRILTFRGESQR
jgi:DNA replication protein DnaC